MCWGVAKFDREPSYVGVLFDCLSLYMEGVDPLFFLFLKRRALLISRPVPQVNNVGLLEIWWGGSCRITL